MVPPVPTAAAMPPMPKPDPHGAGPSPMSETPRATAAGRAPRGRRPAGGRVPGAGREALSPVPEPSYDREVAREPDEALVDDEELQEEEIRAHREIAADARTAPPGAGPQAVAAFTTFLRSLGIDPRRDPEYTVTAQLTADFLAERTAALRREPAPIRPSRYRGHAGENVRLEKIPLYGMCPHHLVPYFGSVSVRFVPTDRICGIGAIARLVRELACVPRLQESFTQAVADAIERDLEPASVEVEVRARHLCLEMRGVEQRAVFVTEARRGKASGGTAAVAAPPPPAGPQTPRRR